MKRLIFSLSFLVMTVVAFAVPAKPGIWKTLKLADGTEVRAQLRGDEHVKFWIAEDGRKLVADGDVYVETTESVLRERLMIKKAQKAATRAKAPKKTITGERTSYTGVKKGIVILAQYTDVKFKSANNLAKYKRILNEEGYTTSEGFKGSVCDYFKAQSDGIFELDFDVVGPYTMANKRAYYGGNDSNGDDKNAEAMVVEACKAANAEVNFADYDWDGDGYVDQVFVLYAGTGEADSEDADAIWPHMYELGSKALRLDGVTINTYACSNEVDSNGSIEGIGCFCHEFSHCMGFPDFYDIMYEGNFGMSSFDLMEAGSYNGNGFIPAGYSGYEKMMCSWLEPIELDAENVNVENLKPLSNGGASYIIYNKAHPDEYYMVENRQKVGWDAGLPAKGLMITHVDFDKTIWEYNIPNSILKSTNEYVRYYGYPVNDHQRMTIFHADNDDDSKYWSSYYQYYTKQTLTTDLYPYQKNDSLTNTSKPAATLYNKNTDGTKFMNKKLLNIKQNSDKTMSFSFVAKEGTTPDPDPDPDPEPTGKTIFYESFDKCTGTGGNDGNWSGSVATSTTAYITDNEGWVAAENKAYAGNKCAKYGSTKVAGSVTTPEIELDGTATLLFKAGAWNGDSQNMILSVDGGRIEPENVELNNADWTNLKATVTGTGRVKITFATSKRFFLDEVKLIVETETGINGLSDEHGDGVAYDLSGRRVAQPVKKGLYIINGRKVVIK